MKPETVESLARAVVIQRGAIEEWFKRPEVQAEYEKWLAKRAKDEEVTK